MPHNGSQITCESALRRFSESTAIAAKPHEPPFPEREARRIEGGGARDGHGLGFVRFICLLCGGRELGNSPAAPD